MAIKRVAFGVVAAVSVFAAGLGWAGPWVQAYYLGSEQGRMPPSLIDFSGLTELIHFGVVPNPDGTLDAEANGLDAASVKAVVSAAHAAGKRVLFTVGGYPTRARFEGAMSPANRAAFVDHLVEFLRSGGYDGIDVDMEPTAPSDGPLFISFIKSLRAKLNGLSPRPLLTVTALWTPGVFAAVAGQVDEVNLMTYALSGPYAGWFAWHDSALYSAGRLPSGQPPPSADLLVRQFIAAGVPPAKLGIGFTMAPCVWTGVSGPGQRWAAQAPTASQATYAAVAELFGLSGGDYLSPYYRWDARAQAPYLSVTDRQPGFFVSYDNELSARAKADYIRAHGLGGLVVWDLQGGYQPGLPEGRRQGLAEAVKEAFFGAEAGAAVGMGGLMPRALPLNAPILLRP